MLNTALTVSSTTPLFLGGLISPLQIIIMVLLLFSTTIIFMGISKEVEFGKAVMLSIGLYIIMVFWTLLVL